MDDTKAANKRFFDIAADVYEDVDTRRSDGISGWLDDSLNELKNNRGKRLLDIGCGTGFVMRKAAGKFDFVVGVDISKNMLKKVKSGFPVCADLEHLPFKDDVFDAETAVAVLHHIPSHQAMFSEAYRVLRKRGVFYSDHDIDEAFVKKFAWLVSLRRRFCDNSIGYLSAKKELTKELYEKSEVHHNGVDSKKLLSQLQSVGFSQVCVRYHWLGLSPIINLIFSLSSIKHLSKGWAPNTQLWVMK